MLLALATPVLRFGPTACSSPALRAGVPQAQSTESSEASEGYGCGRFGVRGLPARPE
jgi:hypothetical protein